MILTSSELRRDIYRVLDHVLANGGPVEIERNGRHLRIVADEPPSRLDSLAQRPDAVIGDSEDFVHLAWSDEWKP